MWFSAGPTPLAAGPNGSLFDELSVAPEGRGPQLWVSDGARTRDTWDHNPVLYQLSYTHHVGPASPPSACS